MTIGATVANALWLASMRPAARAFERALDQPGAAQWRWLARQLQLHASSEFGQAREFGRIDSPRTYARAVELCTYDDLAPHIARIGAGVRDVLATGRVTHLAPTSGSTGARKLIPFNAELQRGFSAAVGAWMHDLVRQRPALVGGPAYWSISPLVEEAAEESNAARTARGAAQCVPPGADECDVPHAAIPIGFADDADYLGAGAAWLVRQAMAAPSSLRHVRDMQAFWRLTALALLRRRGLRLISAWHPSFVDILMDAASNAWEELLDAIASGTCPWIAALPPGARAGWTTSPDPHRADELRRLGRDSWPSWWPQLQVISCWGEQGAEAGWRSIARHVSAHASHVLVQPKGLLATEGVVTVPHGMTHVLALNSHFFEFLDRDGNVRLAQELNRGGEYEVVLSNGGGLWRYRLGDMVACTGHLKATPTLQFLGRAGQVSDLRGEKLSEPFVARALRGAWEGGEMPAYVALRAWNDGAAAGYELLVAEEARADGANARDAAHEARLRHLERALCENPHYALARRLGQLQPLRERSVPRDAARDDLWSHPGRLGDAKPRLLLPAVERRIAPDG
ncbi:MAG: GH3 auxin-responsive promoter family protein [Gemmatimonadaceae bacterium]|nr:GH3 auxin-responsive promoter family protein [Gemmatimonadaceae bacterium]